ncbi:hypothetical protein GCM10027203_32580 [Nonomuraea fastidiosa]
MVTVTAGGVYARPAAANLDAQKRSAQAAIARWKDVSEATLPSLMRGIEQDCRTTSPPITLSSPDCGTRAAALAGGGVMSPATRHAVNAKAAGAKRERRMIADHKPS